MNSPLLSNRADFSFVVEGQAASTFRVLRLEGSEAMNTLYVFDLELISEDHELSLEGLLESAAILTLRGVSGERVIHGVVEQARHLRVGRHYSHYRVRLVPVHALLAHTRDLRIFQAKTVREIVDGVMKEAGVETDRLSWRLTGQYQPRDYCVQYRESDLAFCCRLLEEEGIYFYFDQSSGREVMILSDHSATYRNLPITPTLLFRDESSATSLQEEAVLEMQAAAAIASGRMTLRDYRFRHPTVDLTAQKSASRFQELETYEFPGEYQEASLGRRLAGLRLDEHQLDRETYEGLASTRLLQVGYLFALDLHPRADCNTNHLVTAIEHRGTEHQSLLEESGAGQIGERSYTARFQTIPARLTYRPSRRTPRPQVVGIQSARVVGPAGQEIYPDSFGRVKIQFHWDREGKQDERSSCWVRVSHPWAGQGFGMISLPRIGQEVLVQFLEGDPDRPVIVGRVFNGDNPVPYSLPDHKTRSTWQSRSTPNGTGFNELRFEDLKDSEEVFLHAEKDLNEVIENDHSTLVKRDESDVVWRNQSIAVGHRSDQCSDACKFCGGVGNQSTNVGLNRSETIGKDESVSVKANRSHSVTLDDALSVDGKRTVTIKGDHSDTVTEGNRSTTIAAGNRNTDIQAGTDTWHVKGAFTGTADDTYGLTVTNAFTLTSSSGKITISASGNEIWIEASANVTIKAANIKLDAKTNAEIQAGTQIKLGVGGSSVTIESTKINASTTTLELAGTTQAKLDGGSGHVELGAAGATITGPKITSSAGALNEISGPIVTLN